ncbi:MAG: hypothetical protein H6Q66_1413 [Firmicutes bacterium]|nr:hypothetical protein [Bacillota bacterium]
MLIISSQSETAFFVNKTKIELLSISKTLKK